MHNSSLMAKRVRSHISNKKQVHVLVHVAQLCYMYVWGGGPPGTLDFDLTLSQAILTCH